MPYGLYRVQPRSLDGRIECRERGYGHALLLVSGCGCRFDLRVVFSFSVSGAAGDNFCLDINLVSARSGL